MTSIAREMSSYKFLLGIAPRGLQFKRHVEVCALANMMAVYNGMMSN
jgi:hypothetical protein